MWIHNTRHCYLHRCRRRCVVQYLYVAAQGAAYPPIHIIQHNRNVTVIDNNFLFSADYCPEAMFPFTLEISAIIPPLIIFLNRRRFLSYHTAQTHKCCKQFCTRSRSRHSIGPCITAHRFPAFSYHIACHIVRASAERYATLHFIPYHAALRIHTGYLVQSVRHILFQQDNESYRICTYRDKKGDVIGKAMPSEAINRKNEYINPVIRITVTSHGMLFLLPRPQCSILEKAKRIY